MRMSSRVSEVDKFVNSFDGQTTERIYLIKYSLLIYNDEGEKLCQTEHRKVTAYFANRNRSRCRRTFFGVDIFANF